MNQNVPPYEEKVDDEEVCEIISDDDDEEIQALDKCYNCKMKSGLYFMSSEYGCFISTPSEKSNFLDVTLSGDKQSVI